MVDEYLRAAHARGFQEVRVIHGRGTGAQRASVQSLLRSHPLVAGFADAPPERGGWGATIVWLRSPGALIYLNAVPSDSIPASDQAPHGHRGRPHCPRR